MHLKQEAFATSRRTCLDQGSVIVFADEYSPAEPDHISVPAFDMSNIMVRPLLITAPVISFRQYGMLLQCCAYRAHTGHAFLKVSVRDSAADDLQTHQQHDAVPHSESISLRLCWVCALPLTEAHCLQYNFPSSQGNGDALGTDAVRIPFPDITIRPGTYLDTHLSSQQFSRCTVPVVRFLSLIQCQRYAEKHVLGQSLRMKLHLHPWNPLNVLMACCCAQLLSVVSALPLSQSGMSPG